MPILQPMGRMMKEADNTAAATPFSVLPPFRMLICTAQRDSQWIERQCGVAGA